MSYQLLYRVTRAQLPSLATSPFEKARTPSTPGVYPGRPTRPDQESHLAPPLFRRVRSLRYRGSQEGLSGMCDLSVHEKAP